MAIWLYANIRIALQKLLGANNLVYFFPLVTGEEKKSFMGLTTVVNVIKLFIHDY
jgi:hypothetical protein